MCDQTFDLHLYPGSSSTQDGLTVFDAKAKKAVKNIFIHKSSEILCFTANRDLSSRKIASVRLGDCGIGKCVGGNWDVVSQTFALTVFAPKSTSTEFPLTLKARDDGNVERSGDSSLAGGRPIIRGGGDTSIWLPIGVIVGVIIVLVVAIALFKRGTFSSR